MNGKDFDVIIIGGGVAGISAALWCKELGLDALLLESDADLGGQLLWTYNAIENYLGVKAENGRQMRDLFVRQIEKRNFTLKLNSHIKEIDLENKLIKTQNEDELQAKSIIIATGVSRRKLNVEGENKFQDRGIIKSGKRDGKLVKGKIAAVIGGGDAAFENALILSEFASKVLLIHRSNEFKARSELINKVKDRSNVEIITDTKVKKIAGEEFVNSIELENIKDQKNRKCSVDFVLTRIGVEPNTQTFRDKIKLDEKNYIKTDNQCRTNIQDIYAVGDVANPVSPTISSAAGMGATAVKSIISNIK